MARSSCHYRVYNNEMEIVARPTTQRTAISRARRDVRYRGRSYVERVCETATHRKRQWVSECTPKGCTKLREKTLRFRR